MKKLLIVIVVIFLVLAIYRYIAGLAMETNQKVTQNQPTTAVSIAPTIQAVTQTINNRAGFAIFTNGTFRIFTAPMYHNRSQDVFIEAANPNVLQIKKAGITWNDFFMTMPFQLTKECLTTGLSETFCTNSTSKLSFYINGTEDPEALTKTIANDDKLLVTYGNATPPQVQSQLNQIPNP